MDVRAGQPLVCVRTVEIPPGNEEAFFAWIASNRELRQRYGILMERVLAPADDQGGWLIVTMWQSEAAFERWLAAPEKPAVDASPGHALVRFGKIARYHTVAGY